MPAKIVVFEGPDKVGKDTQTRILTDVLTNGGLNVVRVEPTKAFSWGKKLIYSMLESGAAKRWPTTFQFVQFINRMYFQYFRLPKLLKEYDVVLCDRWALSGWIYGRCEGVNRWLNEWMYNRARKADLTIVFSGTSYRRSQADDSYEKDTDLQARVKDLYRALGQGLPRHVVVDNHGTVEAVSRKVLEELESRGIVSCRCSSCDVSQSDQSA